MELTSGGVLSSGLVERGRRWACARRSRAAGWSAMRMRGSLPSAASCERVVRRQWSRDCRAVCCVLWRWCWISLYSAFSTRVSVVFLLPPPRRRSSKSCTRLRRRMVGAVLHRPSPLPSDSSSSRRTGALPDRAPGLTLPCWPRAVFRCPSPRVTT